MKTVTSAWFVQDMVKATHDMWLKGWDERNGGNISLRLSAEDVAPYLKECSGERVVALSQPVAELANQYFIVTGSGKYFRNVTLAPQENLGLIQVSENGDSYRVLWGLVDGAPATSELPAHFLSHIERIKVSEGRDRVIMHTHATNLIALSYVLEPNAHAVTRFLWEMSTECLVVFPEGVGVLPWMVPGTDEIGEQTAEMMKKHSLVLWPFHGVFGCGATLDEAFGLIDTAEKASEIGVKVLSMGGTRQSISSEELRALAKRFGVTPMAGVCD